MAGYVAPAGSAPVPPEDLRNRRRWLWGRLLIAFVLLVVLTVSGWWMRRHEQVLDRGVRTEALMVEARDRHRLPDVAVVRYTVDGTTYDTALIVDFAEDFRDRRSVTIEYDPENPGHARPLEGWSPTYQTIWVRLS